MPPLTASLFPIATLNLPTRIVPLYTHTHTHTHSKVAGKEVPITYNAGDDLEDLARAACEYTGHAWEAVGVPILVALQNKLTEVGGGRKVLAELPITLDGDDNNNNKLRVVTVREGDSTMAVASIFCGSIGSAGGPCEDQIAAGIRGKMAV